MEKKTVSNLSDAIKDICQDQLQPNEKLVVARKKQYVVEPDYIKTWKTRALLKWGK
jgi:hypothetical protein